MSAALQLPYLWAAQSAQAIQAAHATPAIQRGPLESAINHIRKRLPPGAAVQPEPLVSYAFYRRHTESLLKRYLEASMIIGRSPALLGEAIDRGYCSSRKVRTFEDALIFVLDVESCLKRISRADLQLISRIIVQQNTHVETAALLGLSIRSVQTQLPEALDRLTECLVKYDLLVIPG